MALKKKKPSASAKRAQKLSLEIAQSFSSASIKSTCIQWSANVAQLMATVVNINKNRCNNERFLLTVSDTMCATSTWQQIPDKSRWTEFLGKISLWRSCQNSHYSLGDFIVASLILFMLLFKNVVVLLLYLIISSFALKAKNRFQKASGANTSSSTVNVPKP